MTDNIQAAFAAQAGNLHLATELPCQDSVSFYRGERACCLVLADGAGSVPGSEIASSAVCNALAKTAADFFDTWYAMEDDALKREIVHLAAESTEAVDPGRKPDCTLLLAAICGDGRMLWCHIGDGGIFYLFDDEIILLSAPENGQEPYLTFFLSGKEAVRRLRIGRFLLSKASAFVLCSDGTEPMLYDAERERCAPAVRIIASWMRVESEAAVSDAISAHLNGIFREKTDDDMSLGVITYLHALPDGASVANEK